jgi:hypothetical protein
VGVGVSEVEPATTTTGVPDAGGVDVRVVVDAADAGAPVVTVPMAVIACVWPAARLDVWTWTSLTSGVVTTAVAVSSLAARGTPQAIVRPTTATYESMASRGAGLRKMI